MMDPAVVLRNTARSAWWAILLRGLLAVAFGIVVLAMPQVGVATLIILFAAYAAIDGLVALSTAVSHGRAGLSWGWSLVEGIVSLAVAAFAIARPGVTLLAVVLLIAFRAIALGLFELGGALAGHGLDHRWLLGVTGLVSLLFGVLLIAEPLAGALAIIWAIGVYAIVFGVLLVGVGLHALGQSRHEVSLPHGPRQYAT